MGERRFLSPTRLWFAVFPTRVPVLTQVNSDARMYCRSREGQVKLDVLFLDIALKVVRLTPISTSHTPPSTRLFILKTESFSSVTDENQQREENRCAERGEGAKRKVREVWETWCNLGVVWRSIPTPPPAPHSPSPARAYSSIHHSNYCHLPGPPSSKEVVWEGRKREKRWVERKVGRQKRQNKEKPRLIHEERLFTRTSCDTGVSY